MASLQEAEKHGLLLPPYGGGAWELVGCCHFVESVSDARLKIQIASVALLLPQNGSQGCL